jgi:signal transduction histidine kinase
VQFRKLRNRIFALSAVAVPVVMFAAFLAVYAAARIGVEAENARDLKSAVSGSKLPYAAESGEEIPDEGGGAADELPAFEILADKNMDVIETRSPFDFDDTVYSEACALAMGGPDFGALVTFADKTWMYDVSHIQTARPSPTTPMPAPAEPEPAPPTSAPAQPEPAPPTSAPSPSATDAPNPAANGRDAAVPAGIESAESPAESRFVITFLDVTESRAALARMLATFFSVGAPLLPVIFFISLIFANRSVKPAKVAWERQRRFIADVSHEMKTPLTIMTANYDVVAANESETVGEQKQWLDAMRAGTDRLTKLINSLLTSARMEEEGLETADSPFDFGAVISGVMSQFDAAARARSIIAASSAPQSLIIRGDAEITRQVFEIVYENAVKYTDAGGDISVALKSDRRRVVCYVANSGADISKDDLPKLFDRFYRTDASRSREGGGFGLGLYIARAAMRRLGGSISATLADGGVITFKLVFPARRGLLSAV